jgi:heptosyltransferase-3
MPEHQVINIQPKRILVITLRYLGDTLLLTPLLSSLKTAYPQAEIDVLLPKANLGMLAGNQDVSRLIPMTAKGDILSFVKLLCSLFRRYDLAISTQAGDRPVLCAVLAGRVSMGFVDEKAGKHSWKRRLLSQVLEFSASYTHAVLENLRFCDLLKIPPVYKLTPPLAAFCAVPGEKYAVLHIMPQWRYKQWHNAGWVGIAVFLRKQGYDVVLTGGAQAEELAAIRQLQRQMPPAVINMAGRLSLAQLGHLLGKAAIFIGPDTGITHLAAATGVSTLAIFGPTDPQKWAPWPKGYADKTTPFKPKGAKRIKNVWLLQHQTSQQCVPCQLEGCERNRQSHSVCLDELTMDEVLAAIKNCLSETR